MKRRRLKRVCRMVRGRKVCRVVRPKRRRGFGNYATAIDELAEARDDARDRYGSRVPPPPVARRLRKLLERAAKAGVREGRYPSYSDAISAI